VVEAGAGEGARRGAEVSGGAGSLALYGSGAGALAQWAEVVGEEAALRLSMHFGGRQLHIPRHPRPGSELVQVIGGVAAAALGARFGAGNYVVPLEAGKRAKIVYLRTIQKMTAAATATEAGCTERYVYKVCAEYREAGGVLAFSLERYEDPNQFPLFGEE
jgi:hypothetical protein